MYLTHTQLLGTLIVYKVHTCFTNLIEYYLPALTYQTVLDLNAACRSKRTEAYWLFSS